MDSILRDLLDEYLFAKTTNFTGNIVANKLRNVYPKMLEEVISNKSRYRILGSPGKGNWADNPWIAILDVLITKTPQSGFYPVFLFVADMSGVYLSLNQGVTEVLENYKKDTKQVLKLRALDYRAKIDFTDELLEIDLKSTSTNAKLYEAGNIIAKYYSANSLPNSKQLKDDLLKFLSYYDEVLLNDNQFEIHENLNAIEQKKLRLHYRIERNTTISQKVKKHKGYKCEVCEFEFISKYGNLGKEYIEAHHLVPISALDLGTFILNIEKDFAVLCANCHRMIHRLNDPSNLSELKKIIKNKS